MEVPKTYVAVAATVSLFAGVMGYRAGVGVEEHAQANYAAAVRCEPHLDEVSKAMPEAKIHDDCQSSKRRFTPEVVGGRVTGRLIAPPGDILVESARQRAAVQWIAKYALAGGGGGLSLAGFIAGGVFWKDQRIRTDEEILSQRTYSRTSTIA